MKVAGRVQFTNKISVSSYWLSPKLKLICLYIGHVHNKMFYALVSTITARVAKTLWCLKLSGIVTKIAHECTICSKYRTTVHFPLRTALLFSRLLTTEPFQIFSTEMVGPFDIRGNTDPENKIKIYGVLFVCHDC
jgi:hypothetical protein